MHFLQAKLENTGNKCKMQCDPGLTEVGKKSENFVSEFQVDERKKLAHGNNYGWTQLCIKREYQRVESSEESN